MPPSIPSRVGYLAARRARSVAKRALSPGRLSPSDRGASAGREREAYPEDRAASWPRPVHDRASVRLDEGTDDREAETNATLAPRTRAVDAMEALKDPVRLLGRHARALVRDLEHGPLVLGRNPHVDGCRCRRVNTRVREQVVDHLAQARLGAEHNQRALRLDVDRAP